MTKAPDTIWVTPRHSDWSRDPRDKGSISYIGDAVDGPDPDGCAEYVSRSHCEALVAKARADALREAADVCTTVIKNYSVMKPGGKTYEPMRVQEAAKGMVRLARQDIENLIPETSHD